MNEIKMIMTLSLLIVPLSGHTNFNALVAADGCIVPIQENITLKVNQLLNTINIVKSGLKYKLDIFGVV